MIDEDYDFAKPNFFQHQWGLFLLLLGLIVMGIFWWNDSIESKNRISELTKEKSRLQDKLKNTEAELERKSKSKFSSASFKKLVKKPPKEVNSFSGDQPKPKLTSKTPKISKAPKAKKYQFDVEKFIAQVKATTDPAKLELIDHKAAGIEDAITPLLKLTEDRATCCNALVSLRMMSIPVDRRNDVVNSLIKIIDDSRFGDVVEFEKINLHAYSLLVLMEDASSLAWAKLEEIMNSEHSPWAGYACVTLGLVNDEAEVSGRMVELLASPFDSNRLVVVRKLPEFVEPKLAEQELQKMYGHEVNDKIKKSIVNSMNRLETMSKSEE